ncbi:MAG: hypothetical protein DI556_09715 [Rhodovulum sulfidophilum]|uniref:DUF1376 domain-containing protein n=1 Tax=Rhodovulum sulfidophilum TaxID=35806 RepID=A0A2W5NB13_RHOSU|nr:MAG: hypothetical protein DI556_09715 [Rhodovulum sulfidophilum]
MSGFPSLPLFVREYLVDTVDLSLEQSGAYLHLLMHAWVKGGSLPDDERKLASMARVSVKKWRGIWPAISHYWRAEDGVLTNKRLSQELQYVTEVSEKRRAAGARGGRARSERKQQVTESPASNLQKPGESTQTNTNTPSVAKATGADGAAVSYHEAIWQNGVAYLKRNGVSDRSARSLLGKLKGVHGDEAVYLALAAAAKAGSPDPAAYIVAALKPKLTAVEQKADQWGIPDAQPVRVEPRPANIDAVSTTRAADLSRVQPPEAEEDGYLPLGDDDVGWSGRVLPPLRLVGGSEL